MLGLCGVCCHGRCTPRLWWEKEEMSARMLRTWMPGGSVSSLIEGRDNDVHVCKDQAGKNAQWVWMVLSEFQQWTSDFIQPSLPNPKAKGGFWEAKPAACCCASGKKRQLTVGVKEQTSAARSTENHSLGKVDRLPSLISRESQQKQSGRPQEPLLVCVYQEVEATELWVLP